MIEISKIFKIILLFLRNELKTLKLRYEYICTFLNEINLIQYFFLKINFNKNLNIFLIDDQNKYILALNEIYNKKTKRVLKKKIILVESFINHPVYTISQCFIAKKISHSTQAECQGILRVGDVKGAAIMHAFGIKKIIYINEGSVFSRFYYLCIAYNYLKKIKNIKELLSFTIDKIEYGRIIYEQQIRFKKDPNIKKIYSDFCLLLAKSLIHNYQFHNIFKKYNKTYLVQSETQFFPYRICMQNALKFKNKVISRSGVSLNGFKVYKKYSERNENRIKILQPFFNSYYKNFYIKNEKKINSLFLAHNKINMSGEHIHSLSKNKKNYTIIDSKKKICDHFKWELNKPIVIIYSHAFTDGNLHNKWNLFENDMVWLRETLKTISTIDNVNWIIKPHPNEKYENAKISSNILFKRYSKNKKNIKFLSDKFKVQKFEKIYFAAITSHGTAGFQFPGYGIPTIVCGDTPYASLGFNVEPKTQHQYFQILENIKNIKINKNAIKRCKFFYYFFHIICTVKNPLMFETNISNSYNKKLFWKKALKVLIKNKNFDKNFTKSLEHLIVKKNTTLVNLEKINSIKNINL